VDYNPFSSARHVNNLVLDPFNSVPRFPPTEQGWETYDEAKWAAAGGGLRQKLDRSAPIKDCIVCADEKAITAFPLHALTDGCTHPPNTCLDCVKMQIKTELSSKVFHEQVVGCPECKSPLSRDDIQQFADSATFTR
jgi:hypothetical protein